MIGSAVSWIIGATVIGTILGTIKVRGHDYGSACWPLSSESTRAHDSSFRSLFEANILADFY